MSEHRLAAHRGADALAALLDLHGVAAAARTIEGAGETADEIVTALRAHDVPARLVEIDRETVAGLELPALIAAAGGGWSVLATRADIRAAVMAAPATAIETWPPATPGQSFASAMWRWARRHVGGLGRVVVVTLLIQLLAVSVPFLSKYMVDRVLREAALSSLTLVSQLIVLIAVHQAVFGLLRLRMVIYLRSRFEVMSNRRMLDHVLRVPLSFLHGSTAGELLQGFGSLAAARDALSDRTIATLLGLVPAVLYFIFMAAMLPGAAIAVAAAGALMIVAAFAGAHALRAAHQKEIDLQARQRGFLLELLQGIATVKGAGAESRVIERWGRFLLAELIAGSTRQVLALRPSIGIDFLRHVVMIGVFGWAGASALRGDLSIGGVVAFLQMSTAFMATTFELSSLIVTIGLLIAQMERPRRFLRQPAEALAPAALRRRIDPVIAADDLWFRYDAGRDWVLSGTSFRVAPHEKRLIEGPSGSGKSTMLRLLCGLYSPERGTVLIGGMTPAAARRHFMYLPQTPRLYAMSILENLRAYSAGAPLKTLVEVARETGLHDWVSTMPMHYHTVLSVGGANISGGQRQLIALTAMLASNRQVLFLDEPMSQLDNLSRARVAACSALRDKTVIYAAHVTLKGDLIS